MIKKDPAARHQGHQALEASRLNDQGMKTAKLSHLPTDSRIALADQPKK
jgi:hypothetical protein